MNELKWLGCNVAALLLYLIGLPFLCQDHG